MKLSHTIRRFFDHFRVGSWGGSLSRFGLRVSHPLESLGIEQRADGRDCLLLTKAVGAATFPRAARYYVTLMGGQAGERRLGPAEQVWEIEIRGLAFFLCWDAQPAAVTLHPRSGPASRLIPSIRDRLAQVSGRAMSEAPNIPWAAQHEDYRLRLEALSIAAARHRRSTDDLPIPAQARQVQASQPGADQISPDTQGPSRLPSLEEVRRDLANRLVGCICGGALGDALGGPYEGRIPPFELDSDAPLRLSDDTQLTLATCEAIEVGGEVEAEDVAARLLDWYRMQRIVGLGASTLKAMRDLDAGAHWMMSGRRGEYAAGNGAAMRIAPLAFALDLRAHERRQRLRDITRITHQSDEAHAGAMAVAVAIQLMATDRWAPSLSLPHFVACELPDSNTRDVLFEIARQPKDTTVQGVAELVGTSGYVAESVPVAIFAAQRVADIGLAPMLREVIRAGGDTDTIASMAGQIGGAWLGAPALGPLSLPNEGLVLKTTFALIDRIEHSKGG